MKPACAGSFTILSKDLGEPMAKSRYSRTVRACYIAYIVQAIVDVYASLLFVQFRREFGIPLAEITLLVTVNFLSQLLIDLVAVRFIDRIGYRAALLIAHILASVGLGLMTILPTALPDPFVGLLISVIIFAGGGGLLEVVVSPAVEACPAEHKETRMALLHSFYSWGVVIVIAGSAAYFALASVGKWRFLNYIWMIVPLANAVNILTVPFAQLVSEEEEKLPVSSLFKNRAFWLLFLMMVCAGAADHGVTQWASSLAEMSLGVSKAVGDLLGPMMFAVFMGLARLIYGKLGKKIDLTKFMLFSAALNLAATLMIALVPAAFCSFLGCALCGFSVAALWPGTLSLAAKSMRRGGNALFALLALAGDIGCSAGPTVVGFVASALGEDLKAGIGAVAVFPALMLILILVNRHKFAAGERKSH